MENNQSKLGILYVIATPIGNLGDITLRALETLKSVDFIFAEDTRVTAKLLNKYEIKNTLSPFHEHSNESVYLNILNLLKNGKNLALVTDAGTPCISDPGFKLIAFLHKNLPQVIINPIPGASAVIAALSVSGISSNQFTFLGFPPNKKGRQTFFVNLKQIEMRPVVFYESTHRLQKALDNLADVYGLEGQVIVASELTKMFEKIFSGNIKDAKEFFVGKQGKGEFVIIVP